MFRLLKLMIVSMFITLMIPMASNAMSNNNTVIVPVHDSTADAALAAKIVQRVYEIQAMDKSNLSPVEKKALRKELTTMKSQADGLNSRVYLSVGAIIIIILLLILILR